jgi:hypothetical protein
MENDKQRALTARAMLAVRHERKNAFPTEIFDEFAWEMLLELFASLVENSTITEADLLSKVRAPRSVGHRWLQHLVVDGQVVAGQDGGDVAMTAQSIAAMRAFLDRATILHASSMSAAS